MSSARKYTNLPDLDDAAPDIYETPDLTDDTSTQRASTNLQPESPTPSDDEPDADEITGISRRRLNPDEARNQFLANGQKSHIGIKSRARSRRRPYQDSSRRRENGHEETDEEAFNETDVESLDEKIARLQREATEAQEELARRQVEEQNDTRTSQKGHRTVEELDQALRRLHLPISQDSDTATERLLKRLDSAPAPAPVEPHESRAAIASTVANVQVNLPPEHVQVLRDIADFDKRLSSLESALGYVGNSSSPDPMTEKPIIPLIISLDKQISLLSSTSGSTLETMNEKVRALLQETQRVEQARKAAKAAQDDSMPGQNRYRLSRDASRDARPSSIEIDAELASKINALYGTLPSIESLAPLLPPILERLRSLRALHADAASASQNLSRVESRQDEMEGELKSWKEGLENLEGMMKQGEQTMRENMGSIEGWVKELEGRMK